MAPDLNQACSKFVAMYFSTYHDSGAVVVLACFHRNIFPWFAMAIRWGCSENILLLVSTTACQTVPLAHALLMCGNIFIS